VLFGTHDPVKFDTALVLHGNLDRNEFAGASIVVTRCDTDQYDDIIISDGAYDNGSQVGELTFIRGGVTIDSSSIIRVLGTPGAGLNSFTGVIAMGHIHGRQTHELLVLHYLSDTAYAATVYPLGVPDFRLVTTDTLYFNCDSLGSGAGGFTITDIDNDSVDDVLLGGSRGVLVYGGGETIHSNPTHIFHRPFETSSALFGAVILNLGDITGRGYSSLLVTDPDASLGNQENVAIFLYNIGKGLEDKSSTATHATRVVT